MSAEWADQIEQDSPIEGSSIEDYRTRAATNNRKRLLPAKYELQRCSMGCSLNPHKLPGELGKLVHEWFEEARNDDEIHELALRAAQINLSTGAISRHRRNHLVKVWEQDIKVFSPEDEVESDKQSHVGILELMIQRGAQNLPTGRISPDLLLKAMDMHYKLTQGSAMDNTLQAIAKAMSGTQDEEMPMADDYVNPDDEEVELSEDEQQQVIAVS